VREGAVGVRFGPVQQAWWEAPLMGDILEKAASLDVPVLLFLGKDGGRAIEWVAPVLRNHPNTKVVIDHMADVPPTDEEQIAALLGLKTLPNLYVKISHTWAISAEGAYPWSDGVGLARRVVTAFGAERAMFASDWPVCTRPAWPGGGAAYEQVRPLINNHTFGISLIYHTFGISLILTFSFHRRCGSQRRKWRARKSGGARGAAHCSGAPLPPSSSAAQLKAQGPSRTCNESKEEGEEGTK